MAISVTKHEAYTRWKARLENTQRSAKAQYDEYWKRIEDGLAGEFPALVDGAVSTKGGGTKRLSVEQINDNLLLWGATYYDAISYVEFPEFRFARDVKADKDVVEANQNLAADLFDDGGGMKESAKAMRSSMSRGVFCLFVDIEDEDRSPEQIINASLSPSDFTDAALANPTEPIEIPSGVDAEAISEAAEGILSSSDVSLGLRDDQLNALRMLSDAAQAVHAESLKGPHSVSRRCRVKFTAYPYGSWFWWDVSVTDLERIGHLWRKLVYSPERYLASERFNAASKKWVRDRFSGTTGATGGDGQASGASSVTSSSSQDLDSSERVTVYEGWDRVNWKRIALVDGFDDFAHASDKYPYLGKDGRPVLRNFWPCAIVVPIKSSQETAEAMTGVPLLEPGWPHQIEHIKVSSAYIQATKRSKRQAVFPNGMEKDWIEKLMSGPDGSGQALPAGYDKQRHGDPVSILKWDDAPIDYMNADALIIKRFCTSIHVAELTMTSESPNPNLGQDKLAMAGADTMQGMILRSYESGTAEAVEIGLTLFRAFASTEEITAYLGPGSDFREPIFEEATDWNTGITGPTPKMVPDPQNPGAMIQDTKPSRVDKFRAVSLDRNRLSCRFSVNVKGDTQARVVQMQNYVALNNATIDPTTMAPYKNPSSLMDELADMQDIHGVEDFTEEEKAAMLAMRQPVTPPGGPPDGGGAPGGGAPDGRKSNDGRGPPGIPGKQGRERGPMTGEHQDGINNRPPGAPR